MNSRALWACLLGCCGLWAGEALAAGEEPPVTEGSPDSSFMLGVRTGVGLALGPLVGGSDRSGTRLRDRVSVIAPVQLDVGVLQDSRLYAGAYVQHSLGTGGRRCPEGARCHTTDLRFGLTASYHLTPVGRWRPWLGVGAGYEILWEHQTAQLPTPSFSFPHQSVEFLNVQAGADVRLGSRTWVGPLATYTVGNFLRDGEPGYHSWLIGGVRLQVQM